MRRQSNPFVIKTAPFTPSRHDGHGGDRQRDRQNFIKVTKLSAVTIENSQFKGGNAGFGPGSPLLGGEGFGTPSSIAMAGSAPTGSMPTMGYWNAKLRPFNNVVMRETCQIPGQLDVNVVGDITTPIKAVANFSSRHRRARNVVCIDPVTAYGNVSGQGTIGMAVVFTSMGWRKAACPRRNTSPRVAIDIYPLSTSNLVSAPGKHQCHHHPGIEAIGGGAGIKLHRVQWPGCLAHWPMK